MNIHVIRRGEPDYPEALAAIHDPPPTLYVRGNPDAMRRPNMVAVVGTRMPTRYGEDATAMIARGLAGAGATIVSGLALGIDAVAHHASLDVTATTVAVLASGVDAPSVCPRTNSALAERIARSGGALVSEYAPGTAPQKHFFIARNRIIAGLCRATAIIEAPQKSGALATADFAMESGREVFAVPGPITSPKSAGTNALIAAGAIPALSVELMLAYLGLDAQKVAEEPPLDGDAGRVLTLLEDGQKTTDDIMLALGLAPRAALAAIAALELAGRISTDGIRYRKTLTRR